MNFSKVVVSAEERDVVIYAQVDNLIIGIKLDPLEAMEIADDLQDRARIIIRAIEKERGSR
jgi:hypothetical protein